MAKKVSEDFSILSAIWIIASNDENAIITYEGIKYRLKLPKEYDICLMVQRHGELFRQGVPKRRFEAWKAEMKVGKHLPSWIRDMDEADKKSEAIDKLTSDNVFRSQFRSEDDAPRSPIEIIDWGVQHIERLRRADLEKNERTARSWEIWLVFCVGILNVIATVVSAVSK